MPCIPGVYDNPLEALRGSSGSGGGGGGDMGEGDGNGWSTDQYNPGVATVKSPEKKAELAAVSAVYKLAVDQGRTEVPEPKKDPFVRLSHSVSLALLHTSSLPYSVRARSLSLSRTDPSSYTYTHSLSLALLHTSSLSYSRSQIEQ